MENYILSVRALEEGDIPAISQYWLGAGERFLEGMGVDINKMPVGSEWKEMLLEQLSQPMPLKKSLCIIWQVNGRPVGHSNINKIILGCEAYMHLHIWNGDDRKKGFGSELIRLGLPWFFENYSLKRLYCETYALNAAPGNALQKAGFVWVKKYITVPGWLNFEQEVNLWELTRERYERIVSDQNANSG